MANFIGPSTWNLGGSVRQVIQNTSATRFGHISGSSPSAVQNINVTITPTSSSSKVLVIFNVVVGHNSMGNYQFYLYKNGSSIGYNGTSGGSSPQASVPGPARSETPHEAHLKTLMFLDSPSTTSSTLYQLYHSDSWDGSVAYFNRPYTFGSAADDGNYMSTMIAMEIAQ